MFNLKNIIRENILYLQPYASARDKFSGRDGVFLDANENPFGSLNRYPDPYQIELKQKLSELKDVSINNIFVGNGSDEVIDLAFRIFCNPGKDKALIFSPTYGMYEVTAAINDVELIKIPLNQYFQIDTEIVKKYITNSNLKLIFICSPNNPTGNSVNPKDIEFILNNFNGIVMIDEAYIDFSPSNSCVSMLKLFPNLIVSQTFSKAWGLASARVGIAYANEDVIDIFNKVKPPYNVSKLNQQAAIDALSNLSEFEKNKQIILSEKEKLKDELLQLALVKKVYSSDANFLLVEVTNTNIIYQNLISQKIITRNRNSVINSCIRISVGTPKENVALLIALKKIAI